MQWKEILEIIMAAGVAAANAIGLHIKYGKTKEQKDIKKAEKIKNKTIKMEKKLNKLKGEN